MTIKSISPAQLFAVGDRVRMLETITQPASEDIPEQHLCDRGEVLVVRRVGSEFRPRNGIWPLYVSHEEITDNSFGVSLSQVQKVEVPVAECSEELRRQGKPYPRTCAVHGISGCPGGAGGAGGVAPHQQSQPPGHPAPESCPACHGSGSEDSGGFTPWGAPINVPCSLCGKPPVQRSFHNRIGHECDYWLRSGDEVGRSGRLLAWSTDHVELDGGVGQCAVGVVEDLDTGECHAVHVSRIRFNNLG